MPPRTPPLLLLASNAAVAAIAGCCRLLLSTISAVTVDYIAAACWGCWWAPVPICGLRSNATSHASPSQVALTHNVHTSLRAWCAPPRTASLQARTEHVALISKPIVISESSRCPLCDARLHRGGEAIVPFAVYPNGTIVCRSCAKDLHTCPATGQTFGSCDRATKD